MANVVLGEKRFERPFTLRGALAGARRSTTLALGVFIYGIVWGLLSRQAGLSLVESVMMSGLVAGGSSQIVALTLWTPLQIGAIWLSTLAINLRHVLMGVSLQPWFKGLPAAQTYLSAFFMFDESWALSVREFDAGEDDRAFLLGCGLALFSVWLVSTALGQLSAGWIHDPQSLGLDFIFIAAFVAMLVGRWRGKSDLLPWAVAAAVALASAHWLPGKWYILTGGLAGSLAGAWGDVH